MNILIAVTHLQRSNGGVCTHVMDLCRGLCKLGHNVILTADPTKNNYQKKIEQLTLLQNGKKNSFKFIQIPFLKTQNSLKDFLHISHQVLQIVKQENITLIHSHGQAICLVGVLIRGLTGVPFIWTNHIDEIARPKLFKKILHIFKFPIISVSSDLKKFLIREYGVKEKRIYVVPNGIDMEEYLPLSSDEKRRIKYRFGVEDKYVISILARITYGKGHNYLLKAISKLQQEKNIPQIKVLFAGELYDSFQYYLDQQLEYAKDNRIDVDFLGFQSPREIFGISDLSVLPSIYEGFALTCLESLAMECPVIRSDTPGWSDMQDICMVFPKKNVDKLAEQILYAIRHPEEMRQMAIRGKEKVADVFTKEQMALQTAQIYEEILR